MPKIIPFLIFISIIISNSTYSQFFSCDSIQISNVNYTPDSLNQISLMASNANLDIISYPGFVLLNDIGDTVAKEIVNYFGIGFFPQQHFLQAYQPISNPFAGTIELHSLFYDSLRCVFPFILDTTLHDLNRKSDFISIYPNPTSDILYVKGINEKFEYVVFELGGKQLLSGMGNPISLSNFKRGSYFVKVEYENKLHVELIIKY
ncbi:MAG: T9SS type A sorting domain-containing protein [Bacteroidota bacterium]|nr:T9SS type A sorting domain-containing protein [Bacteroidota bacterium]